VLSRAQCHLVLGALEECIEDIGLLCTLTRDKRYDFDRECMQAIMVVFRDQQEIYFDEENVTNQVTVGRGTSRSLETTHSDDPASLPAHRQQD